jgi:protein subunit release factor B
MMTDQNNSCIKKDNSLLQITLKKNQIENYSNHNRNNNKNIDANMIYNDDNINDNNNNNNNSNNSNESNNNTNKFLMMKHNPYPNHTYYQQSPYLSKID